ncbi:hypothetical protein IJE86_09905 [bacterium]|nr:hypothetical protein [bacterium]
MPIPDFDYKTFATNLAQQAAGVVPPEISKPDKDYIVSLVLNFCNMSGEALYNDTEYQYTADNAYIITQFIGEWTFHKSIDLIHGKIPRQHRDKILQQIAFTVFEIAKQCIKRDMPQQDIVKVVETHVQRTYQKALAELQKRGALTAEQANNAARMSNLDDMSKQQAGASASDTKLLKLVAFAMVLRTMPKEKAVPIIQRFSPEDAQILQEYLLMDDLENKLDSSVISKYLNEIKANMPAPSKQSMPKIQKRLNKIVKQQNKKYISRIVENERPFIKDFVLPDSSAEVRLTPRIADVICGHIEEKIS